MKVLICGSRNWARPIPIDVIVGGFASVYGYSNVTVIHGAAAGADSMAGLAADRHGVICEDYPADWQTHGKAAGPIRNQRMIDEAKPDVVVAFTNDLASSHGTADLVDRAKTARHSRLRIRPGLTCVGCEIPAKRFPARITPSKDPRHHQPACARMTRRTKVGPERGAPMAEHDPDPCGHTHPPRPGRATRGPARTAAKAATT